MLSDIKVNIPRANVRGKLFTVDWTAKWWNIIPSIFFARRKKTRRRRCLPRNRSDTCLFAVVKKDTFAVYSLWAILSKQQPTTLVMRFSFMPTRTHILSQRTYSRWPFNSFWNQSTDHSRNRRRAIRFPQPTSRPSSSQLLVTNWPKLEPISV